MSLSAPYPPGRVTFLDIAEVVATHREHSYARWFLEFDHQPNSNSLMRSLSLPSGALRKRPAPPKKEPLLPYADPFDPYAVSPVRTRYESLHASSPSRVRSKKIFDTNLDQEQCTHLMRWPCRLCYDQRLKSFEEQVKSLKSSVAKKDLTRTERHLRYTEYRSQDPKLQEARKQYKALASTYAIGRAGLEDALEQRQVPRAMRLLRKLEEAVTVSDDFMVGTRDTLAEWEQKRWQAVDKLNAAIDARSAPRVQGALTEWPFSADDSALAPGHSFMEKYEVAKAELWGAVTAKDEPTVRKCLDTWEFDPEDRFAVKGRKFLDAADAPEGGQAA